jgi:hypothetical protein
VGEVVNADDESIITTAYGIMIDAVATAVTGAGLLNQAMSPTASGPYVDVMRASLQAVLRLGSELDYLSVRAQGLLMENLSTELDKIIGEENE